MTECVNCEDCGVPLNQTPNPSHAASKDFTTPGSVTDRSGPNFNPHCRLFAGITSPWQRLQSSEGSRSRSLDRQSRHRTTQPLTSASHRSLLAEQRVPPPPRPKYQPAQSCPGSPPSFPPWDGVSVWVPNTELYRTAASVQSRTAGEYCSPVVTSPRQSNTPLTHVARQRSVSCHKADYAETNTPSQQSPVAAVPINSNTNQSIEHPRKEHFSGNVATSQASCRYESPNHIASLKDAPFPMIRRQNFPSSNPLVRQQRSDSGTPAKSSAAAGQRIGMSSLFRQAIGSIPMLGMMTAAAGSDASGHGSPRVLKGHVIDASSSSRTTGETKEKAHTSYPAGMPRRLSISTAIDDDVQVSEQYKWPEGRAIKESSNEKQQLIVQPSSLQLFQREFFADRPNSVTLAAMLPFIGHYAAEPRRDLSQKSRTPPPEAEQWLNDEVSRQPGTQRRQVETMERRAQHVNVDDGIDRRIKSENDTSEMEEEQHYSPNRSSFLGTYHSVVDKGDFNEAEVLRWKISLMDRRAESTRTAPSADFSDEDDDEIDDSFIGSRSSCMENQHSSRHSDCKEVSGQIECSFEESLDEALESNSHGYVDDDDIFDDGETEQVEERPKVMANEQNHDILDNQLDELMHRISTSTNSETLKNIFLSSLATLASSKSSRRTYDQKSKAAQSGLLTGSDQSNSPTYKLRPEENRSGLSLSQRDSAKYQAELNKHTRSKIIAAALDPTCSKTGAERATKDVTKNNVESLPSKAFSSSSATPQKPTRHANTQPEHHINSAETEDITMKQNQAARWAQIKSSVGVGNLDSSEGLVFRRSPQSCRVDAAMDRPVNLRPSGAIQSRESNSIAAAASAVRMQISHYAQCSQTNNASSATSISISATKKPSENNYSNAEFIPLAGSLPTALQGERPGTPSDRSLGTAAGEGVGANCPRRNCGPLRGRADISDVRVEGTPERRTDRCESEIYLATPGRDSVVEPADECPRGDRDGEYGGECVRECGRLVSLVGRSDKTVNNNDDMRGRYDVSIDRQSNNAIPLNSANSLNPADEFSTREFSSLIQSSLAPYKAKVNQTKANQFENVRQKKTSDHSQDIGHVSLTSNGNDRPTKVDGHFQLNRENAMNDNDSKIDINETLQSTSAPGLTNEQYNDVLRCFCAELRETPLTQCLCCKNSVKRVVEVAMRHFVAQFSHQTCANNDTIRAEVLQQSMACLRSDILDKIERLRCSSVSDLERGALESAVLHCIVGETDSQNVRVRKFVIEKSPETNPSLAYDNYMKCKDHGIVRPTESLSGHINGFSEIAGEANMKAQDSYRKCRPRSLRSFERNCAEQIAVIVLKDGIEIEGLHVRGSGSRDETWAEKGGEEEPNMAKEQITVRQYG